MVKVAIGRSTDYYCSCTGDRLRVSFNDGGLSIAIVREEFI